MLTQLIPLDKPVPDNSKEAYSFISRLPHAPPSETSFCLDSTTHKHIFLNIVSLPSSPPPPNNNANERETRLFSSQGCNAVSRCVVGPGAAVINCGLVSCSQPPPPPPMGERRRDNTDAAGVGDGVGVGVGVGGGGISRCCFANGLAVAVGPETRGRELACYATMTLAEAAAAAADRASSEAVEEQRLAVEDYAELARYLLLFVVDVCSREGGGGTDWFLSGVACWCRRGGGGGNRWGTHVIGRIRSV